MHARYAAALVLPTCDLSQRGDGTPMAVYLPTWERKKKKEVSPCWDRQLPRKINYVREDQLYRGSQIYEFAKQLDARTVNNG